MNGVFAVRVLYKDSDRAPMVRRRLRCADPRMAAQVAPILGRIATMIDLNNTNRVLNGYIARREAELAEGPQFEWILKPLQAARLLRLSIDQGFPDPDLTRSLELPKRDGTWGYEVWVCGQWWLKNLTEIGRGRNPSSCTADRPLNEQGPFWDTLPRPRVENEDSCE